ncbi:isochorismatase family protein [Xylogone sp. PMI_703]|nr:isochorismatase family protein [Xylogone sp. PMI_703]
MDIQGAVTSRFTIPPTYLPSLSKAINTARPSVQIIYVTVAFRPGHPEISASNPIFSAVSQGNALVSGTPDTQIDAAIAPQEGDILVEKKRISAFSGSGLDFILRGLDVETLVLAGIATGGVVLSTVCEAADRDFKIVILRDLCLDDDEDLHNALMDKLFKNRAEVLNANEWLERLKA